MSCTSSGSSKYGTQPVTAAGPSSRCRRHDCTTFAHQLATSRTSRARSLAAVAELLFDLQNRLRDQINSSKALINTVHHDQPLHSWVSAFPPQFDFFKKKVPAADAASTLPTVVPQPSYNIPLVLGGED